ncbi:MAG: pyridoxal-phosphate dependent enzyme [Proteobacteria bacterium]|nr:pyridoxal-phosphate dependent enzyme [Pseudomonadota bacterium]MBI3499648.1 pyridoxal-phosphate dependent enzyme [Pseudomonadota bacterium]
MDDSAGDGWQLVCDLCEASYPLGPMSMGCPRCAERGAIGVLNSVFRPRTAPPPLGIRHGTGLGRYRDLLPCGAMDGWLSRGEGGTPLIESRHIGPRLGLSRLLFKYEGSNPTGSFKDRYVCVAINLARAAGYHRIVSSSTGNLGVSVAAYAAAAGMECVIVVPRGAPPRVLDELRGFDAKVVVTSAEQRQWVFEAIAGRKDWFPIAATFRRSVQTPVGIDGYKTYAYELAEQLGAAPAAMVFPCARGNGLHGAWKGFCEAMSFGWIDRLPVMVSCQPSGSNSLEVSLQGGANEPVEVPRRPSIASSAAEIVSSKFALSALRESKGAALSADDVEIVAAQKLLCAEGLLVDPASALPVACLPRLLQRIKVEPDAPIVCLLTAAGHRWAGVSASEGAGVIAVEGPADLDKIPALMA